MKRRLAILILSLFALVPRAWARVLPQRRTGINRFSGKLHVDVGLLDLFWPRHRERLRSGFVTRVLVRISVFSDNGERPVANAYRRSEIVYDIWDEAFRVQREDGFSHGQSERLDGKYRQEVFQVRTEHEAIRLATVLIKVPIAELSHLQGGARYRIAFRADLNPLSQELVADVQRSLTKPRSGQGRLAGEGLFGSFVSIFVNPSIEDSERQLRFVSQDFVEPRR